MHVRTIVARILGPCLVDLHAKRAQALQRSVVAVLLGGVLSLSALALAIPSSTRYKHRLKSVDRLLGNSALATARAQLYAAVASRWLVGVKQLLLVVDWSDLTPDQRWQWLRASVVVDGRSVTLYEEVHPQRLYGNPKVHQRFLMRVAQLLPSGCVPIVMTDAGFHATWFKMVGALGWSFIGRLRGRDMVEFNGEWIANKTLHEKAQQTALDLGHHRYVRSNPIEVRLILAQRPSRGRHRLNIYGRKRAGRASAKAARAAREPWLLAASPELDLLTAQSVVNLYAQRMRIEQSFRDTKNLRVGQGLQVTRSRSRERLQLLLLIAHLGAFVQRLIGEDAKGQQLELNFLARPHRERPEISTLTLGRRILNAPTHWLARLTPWAAIPQLTKQATLAWASV